MKKTTASESNLAVCNYALGYADRLVAPHLRRNQPTEERYWDDFRRGLSDAERRRPFDPPGTQANDARRGGERIGAPWRTTGRTVANNREGDGKVWTCGWAQYGRLGLSDAESAAAGGGLLYGKYLAVPKQVGGISGVAAIGGGQTHSVAVRGDGTVWAWGHNTCGQLCGGTSTSLPDTVYTPAQIEFGQWARRCSNLMATASIRGRP